jgi:hypothetical protein
MVRGEITLNNHLSIFKTVGAYRDNSLALESHLMRTLATWFDRKSQRVSIREPVAARG